MLLLRLVALAGSILGLAGCGHATSGMAVPVGDAFPDPANYVEVDAGPFVVPDDGRFAGIAFQTREGLHCSSNSRDYLHRIWCSGPRFDAGGHWNATVGPQQTATLEPADPPQGASKLPLLGAGQRIELTPGSTCLTAPNLFACRAGPHGFVLTPAGPRLF